MAKEWIYPEDDILGGYARRRAREALEDYTFDDLVSDMSEIDIVEILFELGYIGLPVRDEDEEEELDFEDTLE